MKSHGYAAHDKSSPLVPYSFDRRDPGADDVVVELDFLKGREKFHQYDVFSLLHYDE